MIVTIADESQEKTRVITDEGSYKLCHDRQGSGDWIVTSQTDELVQGDWMLTKEDAIKFALERAGVLEDANYTPAPDRTSA
jgi:hypothetical protein